MLAVCVPRPQSGFAGRGGNLPAEYSNQVVKSQLGDGVRLKSPGVSNICKDKSCLESQLDLF